MSASDALDLDNGRGSQRSDSRGILVFVLLDMLVFSLLFISYIVERSAKPELFMQAQQALDAGLGFINTLILLTSSWLMVLAVDGSRRARPQQVWRCLLLAAGCGAIFIVLKCIEYGAKFSAGISMVTNDFFMFYFVITFIHLLHVIVGTVAIAVIAGISRQPRERTVETRWIETVGIYWHLVDLLWVLIFPLIYLTRAA